MLGTITNVTAILIGTAIGCLLKGGIKKQYESALFTAMGLAALGIGMEYVVNNIPKSQYPPLFIVSLAIGACLGTWWQVDWHFNTLVHRCGGKSQLGKGLATGILLYCIGALSIVGPVMAAVLFCWQGGIYLVAKYLSASFFSTPLITEISIVGGFLIATTGISLLKIRDIKTLNLLPALLVPLVFFIVKDIVGF